MSWRSGYEAGVETWLSSTKKNYMLYPTDQLTNSTNPVVVPKASVDPSIWLYLIPLEAGHWLKDCHPWKLDDDLHPFLHVCWCLVKPASSIIMARVKAHDVSATY